MDQPMSAPVLPMTGAEYLDSLRDDREVWIYGERVRDVTAHPAFRNSARMLARLYDALHAPEHRGVLTAETDTGNGGFTHPFFRTPRNSQDLLRARDAIVAWQRMVYGWMARTPDYKASFMVPLGINADYYGPYAANARRFYKLAQERLVFLNHAIVNPPVDRSRSADEVCDVFVHVEKETAAGLIVSGAKVVATGSALTHYNFIAHPALPPGSKKESAPFFIVPMNAKGVKLICRASYEMNAAVMGSPFDYPLSSRMDENDAILVFDRVLVPWENVLLYGDFDKINNFREASGFSPRLALHACTRLAVKFDFISGLLLKAVDVTGSGGFRGVQAQIGEVIAWRNLFWGLSDAMCASPTPWVNGSVLPNIEYAPTAVFMATIAYRRVKELIEQTVASGLIYLNSHVVDFFAPELRPDLERYLRGSNGTAAIDRVKLMKLLWDAIGTEFAGRHELFELSYAGNHELIRLAVFQTALDSGRSSQFKGLVESCMSDYDVNGWTAADLINPSDVNRFWQRFGPTK